MRRGSDHYLNDSLGVGRGFLEELVVDLLQLLGGTHAENTDQAGLERTHLKK